MLYPHVVENVTLTLSNIFTIWKLLLNMQKDLEIIVIFSRFVKWKENCVWRFIKRNNSENKNLNNLG